MTKDSKLLADKATPRGNYPHIKRIGDFLYVSGTSSRKKDNSFAGVQVDEMGTTNLNIEEQTRAVLNNIGEILSSMDSGLEDVVDITTFFTPRRITPQA